LAERSKEDVQKISEAIKNLTPDQVSRLVTEGQLALTGFVVTSSDIQVIRSYAGDKTKT